MNDGGAQDRAIEREADDLLDRLPFVQSLARSLVREERDLTGKVVAMRSTGVVVGLTGAWGLGKSSALNLLAEQLKATNLVDVAVFNPWLFKGREELLVAFFQELRQAMGKTTSEHTRDVLSALEQYEWAVRGVVTAGAIAVDLHGGMGAATLGASKFWDVLKKSNAADRVGKAKLPKLRAKSPIEERKELEKKLAASDRAVVVLIDELDRVEDDEVRAVAQLVKAVGDIKGISYLVAYDAERVAQALGKGADANERLQSGEAYLEKIVQHVVPLRRLFHEDVERLLTGVLEAHGVDLSAQPSLNEAAIFDELRKQITTPREVKRLIGSYSVIEPMVRGEVSKFDVLAYAWLLGKSPGLQAQLVQNFERLVDDPSLSEQMARSRDKRTSFGTPEDLFGKAGTTHERLLRLLFPRFGQSREGDIDRGGRISRRHNLIRLLYLGDPPGTANRREVEALWRSDDVSALTLQLQEMLDDGRLTPVMDRLGDILGGLDGDHDRVFWPALASALERRRDWQTGPETNENLSETAYTYLTRLGGYGVQGSARLRAALTALEAHEDLVIAPRILRRDMFIHGMAGGEPRSGDAVMDEAGAGRMLKRSLPLYRRAMLEGRLLRRVPNVEALFILHHAGAWDEELREAFTLQMRSKDARATFAAIVSAPGHSIDQSTLETMMDAASVAAWIDEDPPQVDNWSEISVHRLRRMLRGEHRIGMQ